MRIITFLIIPVLLGASCTVFSKESCMQEAEWYGHTKTCYENVSVGSERFKTGCLNDEFFKIEDHTAKVSHTVIEQCPISYLGVCKSPSLPYNTYYYVNPYIKETEKSCIASGGQWLKPKT
ncbi:MAG: hypothetical protein ACI9T7_001202 [Oleiphilaceae bacterium]|jgi:hypothetical protein